MIQVEDLTRCYGELTAVDAVSFCIDHGEVAGLLGHNGAGAEHPTPPSSVAAPDQTTPAGGAS